jgi:hypothetical protein
MSVCSYNENTSTRSRPGCHPKTRPYAPHFALRRWEAPHRLLFSRAKYLRTCVYYLAGLRFFASGVNVIG